VTILIVVAFLALVALVFEIRRKNTPLRLWRYLRPRRTVRTPSPAYVMFCFVDHFEPRWGDHDTENRGVDEWRRLYPRLAARHRDADGAPRERHGVCRQWSGNMEAGL